MDFYNMNLWLLMTSLFILLEQGNGSNILAIHGTDLNSHFRVFSSVIENLAEKHNITLYVDPKFKYSYPNVLVRSINAPSRFEKVNMTDMLAKDCRIDSYKLFYNNILNIDDNYYESILTQNGSPELLKTNDSYDLLLLSGYGTDHFTQMAHVLDTPLVQVVPSLLMPWQSMYMNNPYSWVSDFSFMILEDTNLFWGRLKKFMKNAIIYHRYLNYINALNLVTQKFFPSNTPKIEEISKRTDLILVNTLDVMGYARPNVQTILEIGGMHIKPAKRLPENLETFISGAGDDGFIYFSLGTVVQNSILSDNIRNAIVNVFRKLPQRVLWKSNLKLENLPENVMISDWYPQTDVLAHKQIKLFILQGGMLSMQEAIYSGVPVLILPVLFDQNNNARLAEEKGFGRSITICEFSEELFYSHIQSLIHNTSYSETINSMSQIMKDRNDGIVEKLNWWIDFIIRHKGTSKLKPTLQFGLWTDLHIDIFLFILGTSVVLLFLTLYLLNVWLKKLFLRKKCKKE